MQKTTFTYTFGEEEVDINQYFQSKKDDEPAWMIAFRPQIPKGATVWPAAILLARYLQLKETELKGKRIIELGAGVGLSGLLLSKYCKEMVITDVDSEVLSLLKENAELNKRVARLGWGTEGDIKEVSNNGKFDLIICADVIYEDEWLKPLWITIDKLLEHSDNAKVIMGHGSRFPNLDAKFQQIGEEIGFTSSFPELDESLIKREEKKCTLFNGVSSSNPLKIWEFKRK